MLLDNGRPVGDQSPKAKHLEMHEALMCQTVGD